MREEAIAERLASEWELTLGEVLPGATCSLVRAGTDRDGREVVLKVPWPEAEERQAAPALQSFSDHGGVALLRTDKETGTVLLPRLRPGTTLASAALPDLEGVDLCADIVLRLRQAPMAPAMAVEEFFADFVPGDDALARDAANVAHRLFETTDQKCLLHGDLHHFNLLAHGGRWVAVDPKGVVGDPSYEVVAFMRNEIPAGQANEVVVQRLRRFVERLGDPPERLWGWAFAQTVRSGYWMMENEPDNQDWRIPAEALAACRREFWNDGEAV